MKRETTSTITYDNDFKAGCDGYVSIRVTTVTEGLFLTSHTDYTLTVGESSLFVNRTEFKDLRDLMNEVINDDD